MSEITRADKVERHFHNSVRNAILNLMEVMDPGEKLRWGSLSYKELLSAAKNRLDAELLHETGFEQVEPEAEVAESSVERPLEASGSSKSHLALDLPKETRLKRF